MSEDKIKQLEAEVEAHKRQLAIIRQGLAYYEHDGLAPCACRKDHATGIFAIQCDGHKTMREELDALKGA